MLSRGWQNMCRRLWHTTKIFRKLAGKYNLVFSVAPGTKTALGILHLWFNYFGIFFQGTWYTLPGSGGERCRGCIHSRLLFCVWGWSPRFVNLSTPSKNTRPHDTHELAKELLDSNFEHFRSGFITALTAFSNLTARKTSAAVITFSFCNSTSFVSDGVIVTGFKRSLKNSHHLLRMFSLFLSKTPFWSLTVLSVRHLLSQRPWMVLQNIFLAYQ